MLNFRKIKKDFSPALLNEGKAFYDKQMVVSVKIMSLSSQSVRLSCKVLGNFNNTYECEIEVDWQDSTIMDSDCDCTYKYDCQHLAAVIFYLEDNLENLVVAYSNEADLEKEETLDPKEKATLKKTFEEAKTKEVERKDKKHQKEIIEEYIAAAQILGKSPFFLPEENQPEDKGELLLIFSNPKEKKDVDIQLALRLPYRSKPLHIPDIQEFLDAIRYGEMADVGNKRFHFSLDSFDQGSHVLLKMLLDHARFFELKGEKGGRGAYLEKEAFGTILAAMYEWMLNAVQAPKSLGEEAELAQILPGLFCENLEDPLRFSNVSAGLRFELEYFESPAPKIFLKPALVVEDKVITAWEEAFLFECAKPGLVYQNTYYRFEPHLRRTHLRSIAQIRDMTIPEPLFGSFVENALPELMRFSEITNQEIVEKFVTLPFTGQLKAQCNINYLDGELEASLYFIYTLRKGEESEGNADVIKVPAAITQMAFEHMDPFVTPSGILSRNLTEEESIVSRLFKDFIYDPKQGVFLAKSEKKIVEFMTEVIPQNQDRVTFDCPENLLDQFLYDDTTFSLHLKETDRVDRYEVHLQVKGHLNGLVVDLLWDCLTSRRSFIELSRIQAEKGKVRGKKNKILVLDLERLSPVVQIFDEIGIDRLDDHVEERPLWSLASIDPSHFEGLPIEFSMSPKLEEIQKQMLGLETPLSKHIPQEIQAELRNYQKEGVGWLERLRRMHLNGVLADDMGLGKTVQAITCLTQYKEEHPKSVSIVVCPTSLVYNWEEELHKFNPQLKVLPIDGTPQQRKKMISQLKQYDVLITSYSLLQKDIESYKKCVFGYAILDEAQHIKNRMTRNAKSVKALACSHRLILTGTPIENSLDELWSLFDFLMPGLLSSYDRFVEKYIRPAVQGNQKNLEMLRRKLSPFILRRMKKDVLSELPPVSEIVYHCQLSDTQKELYSSYAKAAREELSQLVKKEGFDRVQIHVLATLTRLKQICCHPAIFAKEKAELGDSSKYEMLMELLQTLIDGKHKTVIFSQYTRMLQIMRKDLQQQGIRFEYLDGSSKNRVQIVKKFNEDAHIPVFLVSLKAGGSGLNLVGADTVVHYDMWWNPAVENQATDRVHRIGQKQSVSSYKLVTLGTIEEKIVELQERKKGLVKKIINTDEEAISKLTWEEVLELLQA